MHMLLLLAGLAGALAVAAALAYGLVNPAMRTDAVVVAAVLGVAGGLVLLALGAIVGQLRRIADAIEVQPMARGLATLSPPRLADAAAAGANAVAAALALDPEPPVAPASPVAAPPPPDLPVEPRLSAPPVRPPATPPEPSKPANKLPSAAPLAADWPHVDASDRVAPPAAREGVTRDAGPARDTTVPPPLPRDGVTRAVAEPPMSAKPAAPEPAALAVEPPAAEKPRVLKSGVVEGMAYTLYSDGSVDAELPGGTAHFASISAWRAHMREGA